MPDIGSPALPVSLVHVGSEGLQTDVSVSSDFADPPGAPLPLPQFTHGRCLLGVEGAGERRQPLRPRVRRFPNAVTGHGIMHPLKLLASLPLVRPGPLWFQRQSQAVGDNTRRQP